MIYIDVAELAAATNFTHRNLLEARAKRDNGSFDEANALVLDAARTVCRTLTEVFLPHIDALSEHMQTEELITAFDQLFAHRERIREFLNVEEGTLREAGLDPVLVEMVMDRCVAFLDQERNSIKVRELQNAFAAAKYRVCDDAIERMEQHSLADEPSALRRYYVPVLNSAIGATIIAANYKFIGPAEFFFSLSSAYGLSWFPSGVPRPK